MDEGKRDRALLGGKGPYPNSEARRSGHPKRPFATTRFTLRLAQSPWQTAILRNQHGSTKLKQVKNVSLLDTDCWLRDGNDTLLYIDLAKGESVVSTA
ncbi:MAG: hypothetical protein ACKVHO_05345 [Verrucomicrobiia bacterium]